MIDFKVVRKEMEWGGRKLVLETGKLARQAQGAVVVTYGETEVIATVCAAKEAKADQDFFPLTVNYQEKYYKNINGVWSRTDNPYLYSEYLDFTNLEKILTSATYDSKTEYNNGSKLYTYDISTTTLVKIINKEDIDIADNPNKIIVTTNEDNEATKFEFYLTPYVNYKDNNSSSILNISLEYSNFGKVEEIENPE